MVWGERQGTGIAARKGVEEVGVLGHVVTEARNRQVTVGQTANEWMRKTCLRKVLIGGPQGNREIRHDRGRSYAALPGRRTARWIRPVLRGGRVARRATRRPATNGTGRVARTRRSPAGCGGETRPRCARGGSGPR